MGIKGQLADTNGDQYFSGSLKDADVKGENGAKALKGTLVEARPECRSKELVVAISDATHPEVTLNLDAALPANRIRASRFNGMASQPLSPRNLSC